MVFRFHSTRVGIALYFNNYCTNKTGTKKKTTCIMILLIKPDVNCLTNSHLKPVYLNYRSVVFGVG